MPTKTLLIACAHCHMLLPAETLHTLDSVLVCRDCLWTEEDRYHRQVELWKAMPEPPVCDHDRYLEDCRECHL